MMRISLRTAVFPFIAKAMSIAGTGRLTGPLLALAVLTSVSCFASGSSAETTTAVQETSTHDLPRENDQIWLVKTRHLDCSDQGEPDLQVSHFVRGESWVEKGVEGLLAADDPDVRTIVYIHGARVEAQEAIRRGGVVYEQLMGHADDRPVRMIIWSWPTAPAGRPIRDLRWMAARSDFESHYLAWLLARMDPRVQVNLIGFSYGGRVAGGVLHLLGGGELLNRTIDDPQRHERQRAATVLWSPAAHNFWFQHGSYHSQALSHIDRLLILYNPCDRALKFYRHVIGCRVHALGATGLVGSGYGDDLSRIEEHNISCLLGSEHSFYNHVYSPEVIRQTAGYVFGS